MNLRKEKLKLERVIEQEAEQLDQLGLHDYHAEQDYKHLTGHKICCTDYDFASQNHIVLFGAVGYPVVNND